MKLTDQNIKYELAMQLWNDRRDKVRKRNEKLIRYWRSIPWWQFWKRPSFEEQRQIILDNWSEFQRIPAPRLNDYFSINL